MKICDQDSTHDSTSRYLSLRMDLFSRPIVDWEYKEFRQTGIEQERHPQFADGSKHSFPGLIRQAVNGILSFSNIPLKIASWLGIVLCNLSCLLVACVVVWWACDVRIPGMHLVIRWAGPAS